MRVAEEDILGMKGLWAYKSLEQRVCRKSCGLGHRPVVLWDSPTAIYLQASQALQAFLKPFTPKMSASKPKIVVRSAGSSAAMPKASAVVTVAVPKAAAQRVVVAAAPSRPAAKKTVQKVIYVEEEEEEVLTPAQILAGLEAQIASLKSALKVKGLKKDGTPRAKREYVASEAQTAWNTYVQEVREEHGYMGDEEGNVIYDAKTGEPKLAISYKEAMQIASARRKAGDPSAPPAVQKAVAAPKTVVKAAGGAGVPVVKKNTVVVKTSAAPAAVPVKKTAAELRAEFLAKKAAAAAAAQAAANAVAEASAAAAAEEETAPAEEESNEAIEWDFKGQTYYKTSDNLCWMVGDDGERIWAGVYLPEEDRIDDSIAEPSFD